MILYICIRECVYICHLGTSKAILKQFIETLKALHSTIKLTVEWSREEINFLDAKVRLRLDNLKLTLQFKPTDTYYFLDQHFTTHITAGKSISYSQALRYKRICSDNEVFDQRCNDLGKWLMERSYSERILKTQVLKAISGLLEENFFLT